MLSKAKHLLSFSLMRNAQLEPRSGTDIGHADLCDPHTGRRGARLCALLSTTRRTLYFRAVSR